METAQFAVTGEVCPNLGKSTAAEHSMIEILKSKTYICSASSVLMHIIFTKNLTHQEKLFYFLCDSLANIELNSPKRTQKRQLRLSANALATMLNVDRRTIQRFQQSLSKKDYLIVEKEGIDCRKRHQKNLSIPTLPAECYFSLLGSNDKHLPSSPKLYRKQLDFCNLFVQFNFKMLRAVIAHPNLKPTAKLLWIYCYIRSYITYREKENFVFHDSIQDIKSKSGFSENSIRASLKQLQELQFIHFEDYKVDAKDSYRKEKRILRIAAILPQDVLMKLKETPDRKAKSIVHLDRHQPQNDHHETSKRSPHSIKKTHIKKFEIKNNGPQEIFPSPENEIHITTVDKETSVKSIYEDFLLFQEKLVKAGIDSDMQHQMFSQQRLSEENKQSLTAAAQEVDKKIKSKLDEYEQTHQPEPQSFGEFLAFLEPYEKFLYYESLKPQSWFIEPIEEAVVTELEAHIVEKKPPCVDHVNELVEHCNDKLGNEAKKHISSYIAKIYKNETIEGEAQHRSQEQLIQEALVFITFWEPGKTFNTQRERRCFMLSVIANKLKAGQWNTPEPYRQAIQQQIAFNLSSSTTGENVH